MTYETAVEGQQILFETWYERVRSTFGEIDALLLKGRTEGRERGLESRFDSSRGRIVAIGEDTKEDSKERLLYEDLRKEWEEKREDALRIGYDIPAFEVDEKTTENASRQAVS